MSNDDFNKIVAPIMKRFIEKIDSPHTWFPLGLCVLCVMFFMVTQYSYYAVMSIVFMSISFLAEWLKDFKNSRAPVAKPNVVDDNYIGKLYRYMIATHNKSVQMRKEGKIRASLALTDKYLKMAELSAKEYTDNSEFSFNMGNALRDYYKLLEGVIPEEYRQRYIECAHEHYWNSLLTDYEYVSSSNSLHKKGTETLEELAEKHEAIATTLFMIGEVGVSAEHHARAAELFKEAGKDNVHATIEADCARGVAEGKASMNNINM